MESIYRDQFFKSVAQTSDAPMGIEIEKAEGPFFYTADGRKVIDFISGIAVSSLGHSHPKVIKAIEEQLHKHLHVMVYGEFIQKPQSEFAHLITSLLPDGFDRVYFVNSGTEANEGALKLAKKHTGRSKLVSFKNSYHGDTHGSLSVTGRDVYKKPFLPLLDNVEFGTFNDDSVFELIDTDTAAVILEPIQGEGGVIPSQKEWLQKLRARCTEVGALMIFDEIQSGFFRTGSFFVFMEYGVQPDIICTAKAMGGGMPLGAFIASDKIFEAFMYNPPLSHVTTFGGHPLCCAAGLATLKELVDKDYGKRAKWIETTVREKLQHPGIVEIRGKGAMLGMEVVDKELTAKVVHHCMNNNLLLGWTLHSDTLVRLAPPLIIEEDVLNQALDTILEGLDTYYPEYSK